MHVNKGKFERNSSLEYYRSHDLYWENKTYKRKRSIGTGLGPAAVTWIADSYLVTGSRICDTGNNKFYSSKARKFRK